MAADGGKGTPAASGGKMITLKSTDEKLFEVSEAAARLSELLSQMIDGDRTSDSVIPLPSIAAATLEKVVEYINKHDRHTLAGSYGVRTAADEELEKWDADLVEGLGSQDALFDLILAAECLAIDGLLDAACKRIADMMKGKSLEKIRAILNIPDNFTLGEKEEMRREYAWAFPKGRSSTAAADDDGDYSSDEEEEEWEP